MKEKEIILDYFYETQTEQVTFYQIPKVLFTEDRFQSLSSDAKILYGCMLDRISLSIKNKWMDKKGHIYIIFTLEQIMKAIHCGKDKGIKILNELEQKVGLIERVKQGFGKPTLIYIKKIGWKEKKTISDITKEEKPTSDIPKPAEQETGKEEIEEEKQSESKKEIAPFPKCTKVEKTEVRTAEKPKYQGGKNRSIEVDFSDSNNTNDRIKTNNSNTNLIYLSKKEKEEQKREDKMEEIKRYEEVIKSNIEYSLLLQENPYYQKEIAEMISLILEIVCGKRETVWIAGGNAAHPVGKKQIFKVKL